jgi:hypothetical protein
MDDTCACHSATYFEEKRLMQYMMLIYETAKDFDARTTDKNSPHVAAWRAYYKSLVDAGAFVSGSPLQSVATATTVRLKDGKRRVQDGPYADTKEQLGGVIILELPTLDAALECAARCPAAATGVVEIRPLAVITHEVTTT